MTAKTLAIRLGRRNFPTPANIAYGLRIIEPKHETVVSSVRELGQRAREKDPEAVEVVRDVVTGDRHYPNKLRESLVAEMRQNEDLRGIVELYASRLTDRQKQRGWHDDHSPPIDRREIFNGAVSSLLGAADIDTSKLTGNEAQFMASYLERPVLKMLKGDPSHIEGIGELAISNSDKVKAFVPENPQFSDEFFEVLWKMAVRYLEMQPAHCEHLKCTDFAIASCQIHALIANPKLLQDARSDRVLETVALLDNAYPYSFNMFTVYTGEEHGRVLNDAAMTLDFVQAAERIVANPRLWRREMGRMFMSSIAEVIKKLSEQDAGRTRKVRIELLSRAEQVSDPAQILYHVVYTFKSDEDKQALREIADDPKQNGSYLQAEAKKILEGHYEGTAWAI